MNYIQKLATEIKDNTPPDAAPDEGTDDLFLIYACLALAKGSSTTSADVHNAWSAWMSKTNPNHESIKPFDELPHETRQEDSPFVQAIRSVAERYGL